ncbi:MAG: class I SAM-dependent rRNA methyltransferase [Elusimicrobia bacterium]|nr:class I SAM-dependent rRNA methyltransferase [Elusimicrobiota bacterium]
MMTSKQKIADHFTAPVESGEVPTVSVSDRAGTRVERGHLWIFSNEVTKAPDGLEPGRFVQFQASGRFVGVGYYNAHSLIGGRILARERTDDIAGLVEFRLKRALAQRAPLEKDEAARLVYSESDLLPGIVIDAFGSNVVIQSNTAGADKLMPVIEEKLPAVFRDVLKRDIQALVVRANAPIRKLESVEDYVKVLSGDEAALTDTRFAEGGTQFAANLMTGQKTGFFLDQRDNRDHLAWRLDGAKEARVLDLFCYSGGWGLRALKAGAEHVTFVDESADALELVARGMKLNGFSEARALRRQRSVFDYLETDNDKYDVVVADPPAFAKSKKDVGAALRAYEKLNRLAWRRVRPGGLLVTCSCSYQVSEEEFSTAVSTAVGKEKGIAVLAHRGAQASDHPVLLSMPETRYLKCLFLKKVPA